MQTLEAGQESGALLCISASHSNARAGVSVGCCNAQIQNWDLEAGVLTSSMLGHSKEVKIRNLYFCKIIDIGFSRRLKTLATIVNQRLFSGARCPDFEQSTH